MKHSFNMSNIGIQFHFKKIKTYGDVGNGAVFNTLKKRRNLS